jgi:hypothetical protein
LAASGVTVTVRFVDASGASQASETQEITAIPAGKTSYLSGTIFSINVSLSVASMNVTVSADSGVTRSIELPTVSHFLVTHDPELDSYKLSADLTNPYTKALPSSARISLVYFDASNKIIGSDWLTTGAEIQPGATVSFTANAVPGIAYVGASVDPCGGFSSVQDCDLLTPG